MRLYTYTKATMSSEITRYLAKITEQEASERPYILHYDHAIRDLRPWQWFVDVSHCSSQFLMASASTGLSPTLGDDFCQASLLTTMFQGFFALAVCVAFP